MQQSFLFSQKSAKKICGIGEESCNLYRGDLKARVDLIFGGGII